MVEIEVSEIQPFIRQSMVARIATLSRNRRPSITPLYFTYIDGRIWLGTSSWTLAARTIGVDPRASILFQRECDPIDSRILRITGLATVRTDKDILRIFNQRVAFKYVLSPHGLLNQIRNLRLFWLVRRYRLQNASKGEPCVIDVEPQQAVFL